MESQVETQSSARHRGVCEKFSGTFGFITPDEGSAKNIFVHFTGIVGRKGEFRTLEEGEQVEYSIATRNGKPCAVDVVTID